MFDTLNRAVASIIIKGIKDRHPKMSERKTVNLFLGHLGAKDDLEIQHDAFFGVLHFISRPAMIKIIRRMIALDLLKLVKNGKTRLIDVSVKGFVFVANDLSPHVDILYDHVIIQNVLYHDLEKTRQTIADEKHILKDDICDHHVLEYLSQKKPTSLEAMRAIKDISDEFVLEYGHRFLKDIIKYLKKLTII
jgi:superfamily II DNA helicase RecQ